MEKTLFWIIVITPFLANLLNVYAYSGNMPKNEKFPTFIWVSIGEVFICLIPWALFVLVRSIFWAE